MLTTKKFRGTSDSANVEFAVDNQLMILTNPETKFQTLSILITNGATAVMVRIANNVTEEQDAETIFNTWLAKNTVDGSIQGELFANHNLFGIGRIVIIDGKSVLLDKNGDGKVLPVFRFAKWFPEGLKAQYSKDLRAGIETGRDYIKSLGEDLQMFGSDPETKAQILSDFKIARADQSLNQMRLKCFNEPYVAEMAKAWVSTDEAEVKLAFKNAGLDFAKFFPAGLAGGADENEIENKDTEKENPDLKLGKDKKEPEKVEAGN